MTEGEEDMRSEAGRAHTEACINEKPAPQTCRGSHQQWIV
jgi:hypothetical protein